MKETIRTFYHKNSCKNGKNKIKNYTNKKIQIKNERSKTSNERFKFPFIGKLCKWALGIILKVLGNFHIQTYDIWNNSSCLTRVLERLTFQQGLLPTYLAIV